MATNLVAKMGQNYHPLHLSLCHSETVWDNAVYVQDEIAPLMPLHRHIV